MGRAAGVGYLDLWSHCGHHHGAAIRARPVVPIMVSSLVVVFAVFEMLVLPGLAHLLLPDDPMVAAGWMGLAVKTARAVLLGVLLWISKTYFPAGQ